MNITYLKVNDVAEIRGFRRCKVHRLHRLQSMGLRVGTHFKLIRMIALDDRIHISIQGFSLILPKKEASILLIKKIS
jgi:Fe2+ transport system protein FeoA